MVSITATSLGVTFPLYAKAASPDMKAPPRDNDRLIYASDGRVVGVRALIDLNFTVKGGDRLALIGRNGSGKTTLLQVLAGIIAPDEGEAILEGRPTNLINLYLGIRHEATGHKNITLRGLASGRSVEEIEAKRAQIAEFCNLGEFLNMPVLTYSAGMLMRLSFAIATAFEPEILLLDEWISAGDAAFRAKASERMQSFVGQAGILVLASHNRNMLLQNCNRAIWIDAGTIKADGDVEDVLNEYEASIPSTAADVAKANPQTIPGMP